MYDVQSPVLTARWQGLYMTSSFIDKVINDTYRIERVIGTGGMGSVFEASHLRIPKRFAIKLLSRKLARNKEALQRFYREAKITSELGHENIVEVLDFNSTEDGQPYIVMELLEGEDLAHRLYRLDCMDLEQTLRIVQQVASAMEVAHERGIVHRDLKPQNIFLCTREGKDDLVKVLDFGITRVLGSDSVVTKKTTVMGSLYYIAPEQARSSEVGPSADIYSMGCIVYTMLAGTPPFFAEEKADIVEQILNDEPTPVREFNLAVPQAVDRAVLVALRKDPRQRYASMTEFAKELERAMIRSRSKDFERTDLMSARELLGKPAPGLEEPDLPDEPGEGMRLLMDLETEDLAAQPGDPHDFTEVDPVEELDTPLPEPSGEIVHLTDMDMEEVPDTPTPEPLESSAEIVDLTDADMEEAPDTPAPERVGVDQRLHPTEVDPGTSIDWPPAAADGGDDEPPDPGETDIKWPPPAAADPDRKPTNEYPSVSDALGAERRETDKVARVSAAEPLQPRADMTGPVKRLDDQDTGQVLMLRRAHEKVPTDELIPTKVIWKGAVGGAGEDSALFHRAEISEVKASPHRRPIRALYLVVGVCTGAALLVLLAIFVAGEDSMPAPYTPGAAGAHPDAKAVAPGKPVEVTVLGAEGPPPAGGRQGATVRGPDRSGTGVLVVTTTMGGETSWADVYLDGKKAGSTPLRRQVSAGVHSLEVRKAGFRAITRRTEVVRDQTSRIHLELEGAKLK